MSMINLSQTQATLSGGTYTQVNNSGGNHTHVNNISQKGPWDMLQAAAAPSAFHDSDSDNASRCHPNTRVAVINELRDFALRRGDTGYAKIVWMNGAAGAGKSAIARSLCEELSVTNVLLASFFFKRTDGSRNNHASLVATITYQIYGSVPPQYRPLILGVIEHDPLVFNRSVEAQFQALILTPLHDLFESGYFASTGKCLIVIDGLDECSTVRGQIDILKAIQKMSQRADFPFIFLIASRPEREIRGFFRSPGIVPLLYQLELNDTYEPDDDIERFLREKLQDARETHQFKNSIPREWPSNESIQALLQKSSGQFIYASVVIKYVTSNRRPPHKCLDAVLELHPPKGDLPFAELDALYSHIFSCVEDIDAVRLIIGCTIPDEWDNFPIEWLALTEGLDPDDYFAALSDLSSVLSIQRSGKEHYIHILHKSLPDYLCNLARSGKYYIDTDHVLSKRAGKCLRYIQDVRCTPKRRALNLVLIFFSRHMGQLINNIQLSHEDLMSFSLDKCHNTISSPDTRLEENAESFLHIIRHFFVIFLDHLCTLAHTDYAYMYDHYLDEFRQLTNQHPNVYQWPYMTDFSHRADNILALETIRILSKPPTGSSPVTRLAVPVAFSWGKSDTQPMNLLHDAALKCLKLLEHEVNHSAADDTLRYLTWALPNAAFSSELEAACNPQKPFAYAATGDHVLSNLAQRVATAMQDYREKFAKPQISGDFSSDED
ncbi:hypothetical protein D9619_008267 [Psilocybe cf. subviscida]|uniref:Nephrocystin 3-like N-terminal domain-containing protein n=1 Tax=Psilocybe cf. subviscida TaxID=2480587 RepID=A0A8H5AT49_9AGAR|nr:hypothetical protein D9619_008267 [Psilocybe cf. subviscida]